MCLYLGFDHTVVTCGGENNHKNINISDCMTKPGPGHLAITYAVIKKFSQSNNVPYNKMLCDKATSQERYLVLIKSNFLAKPPLQQLSGITFFFFGCFFLFICTMLPTHSEYTAGYGC